MKSTIIYSKKLDLCIGFADSIEIARHYINQFNIQENEDVILFQESKNIGIQDSILHISSLSQSVLLTELELEYYLPQLKKLYDDMKTSITSLIIYSNIGNMSTDNRLNLRDTSQFLYEKMGTFEEFIDDLDKSILFTKIINNPIAMHHILVENLSLNQRYRELTT